LDRVLTVSKLNNYIKGGFEDELILHNIVVSGEILQQRVSGNNSFFLLKEGDDTISCVFFSSAFVYPIGAEVEVLGTVEYYRRTGQISFVAKNVVVKGKGKLQQKLLLAKASLQAEGIFENARPFPLLIKKVAFISSESGAVIHDFYSVLSVSAPYVLADCFSVRVQGEDAAMQIISKLKEVN
jgi:exodeoxyribonuclease VII large subunit